MVTHLLDKQGYGIKRQAFPPSRNRICKDCGKGILFQYYDFKLNVYIERCQGCSIFRVLGKDQALKVDFKHAKSL